ncbi:MAG: hypothetical protein GF331_00990 [Chitinivibrionales bacterium]|nr:hypothetical protein [Chitinivibrionales bacterium]
MAQKKLNLLVNLPPTTFNTPQLKPHLSRLSKLGSVRRRSYNTPEEIERDLGWADAVLMWSWPDIDDDLLKRAGGLRYMGQINASPVTARACLKNKVPFSEARHCWSPAVAEMALTLMLAGLRKTSEYHAAMRVGKEPWVEQFPIDIDPQERELTGRSVGIVGFGGIGQRLAELLAPFAVDLRVYDPFIPKKIAREKGATLVSLKELAERSEVVVLCAANTPGAKHLVDRSIIAALPKGCVLVNVGRSMLVDMKALVERLRRKDMIAMLDVFDREPLQKTSPLRKLPNAFLTPHRAGGLLASVERAFTMLTDDLEAELKGRPRHYGLNEKAIERSVG